MKATVKTEQNKGKKPIPKGLIPYKPGQSGNPAGRPLGSKSILDRIRHFLNLTPRALSEYLGPLDGLWGRDDVTMDEVIGAIYVRSLIVGGKGQDARENALDRLVGRPAQGVDLTSGGKSIDLLACLDRIEARKKEREAREAATKVKK
jgi:hypothetical protein